MKKKLSRLLFVMMLVTLQSCAPGLQLTLVDTTRLLNGHTVTIKGKLSQHQYTLKDTTLHVKSRFYIDRMVLKRTKKIVVK